jgi:DNA replication protein DnaC
MDKVSQVANELSKTMKVQSGAILKSLNNAPRLHPHADPNCAICGGLGLYRLDAERGDPRWGKLYACECWQETLYAEQRKALTLVSNMMPDELSITLESLVGRNDTTIEMIEAAKLFDSGACDMLTLCGGVGLGKSATLMALINAANKREFGSGYYVRFVDLMNIIRAGYKDNSSDTKYNKLINVTVLAIDEIDKAKESEWAQEFRTLFFDDRYRQARNKLTKTVIAMNGDISDLPDHISDRLRWGIYADGGFRVVKVEGQSARPAGM